MGDVSDSFLGVAAQPLLPTSRTHTYIQTAAHIVVSVAHSRRRPIRLGTHASDKLLTCQEELSEQSFSAIVAAELANCCF